MTNGQLASLSCCQAPIWGTWPNFFTVYYSCRFIDVGHPLWQEKRYTVFSCCWASPAIILGSTSCRIPHHISLSPILDFPSLEGQVLINTSPRNRVIQLHPQALCSLFIVFYDSQCYGGGIQPTWTGYPNITSTHRFESHYIWVALTQMK
jgi:hypothetical protein